ncbi:hypothetical protein HPB50_025644 [Hyalomma asiaticum]|uniref:Uncharacterized protein n=1 Tax=Hyalomma asiaticum TaxID=266040 RepID=A0ACB7TFU7_HYAAI|nr:hypothetical protein HPB50_025644 [Hyalomma asiaticum]
MAAVTQVVQCLITTLTSINALGAVAALIDIIGIVLGVLGANLSALTKVLMPLCAVSNVPGCITLLSPDDTCTAPINVSLPGNLNLGECLLTNLLESSSGGLDGLACALVELLTGAAANASFLLKIALGGLATTIETTIQCNMVNAASVYTKTAHVTEEAAIALALHSAKAPAVVYSDSRTAVRSFSSALVSQQANSISVRDEYLFSSCNLTELNV